MEYCITYDDGMTADVYPDMNDYVEFLDECYGVVGKFSEMKDFIDTYGLEEKIRDDGSFMDFMKDRYPEDEDSIEEGVKEDVNKGDRDMDLQQDEEDGD